MRERWVETALVRLPDTRRCPGCAELLRSTRCDLCLLDLSGPAAHRIAAASRAAADALAYRQAELDALRASQPEAAALDRRLATGSADEARPAQPALAARPPGAQRPVAPRAGAQRPGPPPGAPRPGASRPVPRFPQQPPAPSRPVPSPARTVGLQPILAGAGAGLLAVAAVVFVFFTFADDLALRALVTGLVTLITVLAVVALRRLGLRASAEAVAALAVVLALVDAELALQAGLLSALDPALARAVLLGVLAVGLGVVGDLGRIRLWVTGALVLAPLVPLVAAAAAGSGRVAAASSLALLASALVTIGARPVVARSGPRVGSALVPERGYLRAARHVVVPAAALAALFVPSLPGLPGRSGGAVLVLAVALTATVLRLATHERFWLATAGAAAALAGGVAVVGAGGLAAAPVVAGLVWFVLVAASGPWVSGRVRTSRPLATASRADVLLGGALVVVCLALPALLAPVVRVLGTLADVTANGPARVLDTAPLGLAGSSGLDGGSSVFDPAAVSLTLLTLLVVVLVALVAARLPVLRPAVPATTGPRADAPGPLVPGAPALRPVPVVAAGRATAPWFALLLVLGAVLDERLAPVTTFVLLALLAAVLVVVTARPASTAPSALSAPATDPAAPTAGVLVRAVRRRAGRVLRPASAAAEGARRALRRAGATAQVDVERARWRAAGVSALFVATALTVLVSWDARSTATVGGLVVAALLLGARASVPRAVRPALVAIADGYALLVLGTTLGWAGLGGVATLCTVSAVASLVALGATVLERLDRDSWRAVLAVTAVPFTLGIGSVVVERSWWSVGACAAMLALEVTLVVTRRTGADVALRALAAGLVLPTASVGVVSAGALLLTGSGSPVVLPVVALLVAVAAAAARPVADAVAARVPAPPDGSPAPPGAVSAGTGATWVRTALEASAALTGAIAVGLAYGRAAAGPEVAVAVLVLLAVGAGLLARQHDRAGVWWLSAALGTAATWTALAAAGIGLVEAYTLPPALVAIVVGALLARRTTRGWDLAGAGLLLLVAPSLLVLVAAPGAGDVRAPALVALGGVAVLSGAALVRRRPRGGTSARAGARRLVGAGVLAATAGTVEAVHVGHVPGGGAVFVLGLGWALAGAGVALGAGLVGAGAARMVRRDVVRRWSLAPALALGVVGVVANVRPVWGVIGTVWALEVLLLALVVVGVRRALRGRDDVPPAWFTWLLALVAAIGAWSPRELRVEVFSLPLGAGLLVAGYLALVAGPRRADTGARPGPVHGAGDVVRTRPAWPVAQVGSWRTLAPGILAVVGPSVLATYTDARTWRAVLVVVLALVAVLVGTRRHLAAPFVLGVAVLPVEILVVFVSQLGTAISAGPWMLTLAAAGGLLLIIATYYERRIAAYDGAAAYVRDLR
ncbi:SCO7613 C-terminal domain-containing membrane protein [Cellulosimicrobium arenosum]|uniref:Uncharacterized protein n=1 Tax=Cellulosimicrobium arenosum TaxID=2708133 RepID=A0A927J0H1_9MICO|nr:hypothetical protein [Cellulosimicrobium arenosum]MBD8079629.1 hypothetical protein [Cellulosimicrobium arenosum]